MLGSTIKSNCFDQCCYLFLQGFSAAMGKVGAIISDVVFGYVTQRVSFYLSAAFGIVGAIVTIIFLPDTTGMSLDELDRMAKYMLTDEFEHYHGEAINPKHLSLYERVVLKWHKHYDPVMDEQHREIQMSNAMSPQQKAKALEALLDQQNTRKHDNRGLGDLGGDDVRVNIDNEQDVNRFVTGEQQARGRL
eukprot:GHUV01036834.1.p1 GENE.GHUV01036834.1~~GHUV01036834.1.p1  ORF type:complete len:191 (+),score=44.17 GHUV01036834.1:1454-2026(+)